MQQFSLFLFRVNIAVKPGSPQFLEDFAKAGPRLQSQPIKSFPSVWGWMFLQLMTNDSILCFTDRQVKCANPERVQCRIGRAVKQLAHLAWRERLIKQQVDSV